MPTLFWPIFLQDKQTRTFDHLAKERNANITKERERERETLLLIELVCQEWTGWICLKREEERQRNKFTDGVTERWRATPWLLPMTLIHIPLKLSLILCLLWWLTAKKKNRRKVCRCFPFSFFSPSNKRNSLALTWLRCLDTSDYFIFCHWRCHGFIIIYLPLSIRLMYTLTRSICFSKSPPTFWPNSFLFTLSTRDTQRHFVSTKFDCLFRCDPFITLP